MIAFHYRVLKKGNSEGEFVEWYKDIENKGVLTNENCGGRNRVCRIV